MALRLLKPEFNGDLSLTNHSTTYGVWLLHVISHQKLTMCDIYVCLERAKPSTTIQFLFWTIHDFGDRNLSLFGSFNHPS
jgi:hypothetical protein